MPDSKKESLSVRDHCTIVKPVDGKGILGSFIRTLDKTSYKDQKQLPNPTMIDSLCNKYKIVVFTAYLLPDAKKGVLDSWYPSVYFHAVPYNRIVWKVYGAEAFIDLNIGQKLVYFLGNRIWCKVTKSEFEEI